MSWVRCSRNKLSVVPAKAGTHNHRIWFGEDSWLPAPRDNRSLGVWVPAFAGTTPLVLLERAPYERLSRNWQPHTIPSATTM